MIRAVPSFDRELRDRVERNEAFLDAVREVSGATVLADTSKDAVRAYRIGKWTDSQALIVHLVRDSPGSTASRLRHQREIGRRASVAAAIRSWERSVAAARRLERSVPEEAFLRIRYEDLCRDPVEQMERMFAAANLVTHDVEPVIGRGPHVIGNRARLGDARPIRIDDRWRTELTSDQISQIRRRTKTARVQLGYDTRS